MLLNIPSLALPHLPQVADPAALLSSPRDSFQNGLVAKGQVTVPQLAGGNFTCTVGGSRQGSSCSCSPAADCKQEAACFGSLCDYSKVALAPGTAYKVGKHLQPYKRASSC